MADSFGKFEGVKPPGNVAMFSNAFSGIVNIGQKDKTKITKGDETKQPDQTDN